MPRTARKKDPTTIYHIMAHSISEFDLYPDNSDKAPEVMKDECLGPNGYTNVNSKNILSLNLHKTQYITHAFFTFS